MWYQIQLSWISQDHLLRGFIMNASQDCLSIKEEKKGRIINRFMYFIGQMFFWHLLLVWASTFVKMIPWHFMAFHQQKCTREGGTGDTAGEWLELELICFLLSHLKPVHIIGSCCSNGLDGMAAKGAGEGMAERIFRGM